MEKKVYFKLHKVKKQWVTIAVTGLALGLSFASLGYVSAAEQTRQLMKLLLNQKKTNLSTPPIQEKTSLKLLLLNLT